MDGVAVGDAHSVSAVAVIDLGDSSDGRSAHGHHSGDPHGLLSSHSVVVIGGEEHAASLLGTSQTPDEDDEEEDDDEDEDDGGPCGCGEECGGADGPSHMIRLGENVLTTSGPRDGSTTSHGNKRKRVVLSIHEKQQVLQRLDMGEQPVVISRDFGISRQQVSDIKKNKERILAFCIDAKHLSSLRRKTLKATTEYHPGVEQELYRWLIRQRKLGRGVSPDALSHKTTDLFMQYAADDAANVSFRSISVWLRHFKRAHNIKNMDETELARLPTKFTPAMDMNGASQGAGNTDGSAASTGAGGETSATDGSTGRASPSPSMLHETTPTHGASQASTLPPPDDVSAYMTNMDLSHPPPSHPHFLLQNHAPTLDVNASNPYQMLMLSSASLAPQPTTTMPMTTAPTPMTMTTTMGMTETTPLSSCVQLAQRMTSELSRFEHNVALKLDSLDARVEKLCFSVLSTASASHLHTTASRFT